MTTCECGSNHEPAAFFVSVVDAGRVGLLAGPFEAHGEALALVDRARSLAIEANPWAHFYAFGTVALPADTARRGIFNRDLA